MGVWLLSDERYITESSSGSEYLVSPTTICQCTDIKDIHENYIYERDIVRVLVSDYQGNKKYRYGFVEYVKGIFSITWKDEECGRSALGFVVNPEIVGNMIDDPELMEE